MTRRLASAAMALALMLAPPAAQACSTARDYVVLTNFELVALADAIVVATAVDERGPTDAGGRIRFRTDIVLKGPAPREFNGGGVLGPTQPSDPGNIGRPHPESLAGACSRVTFASRGQYIAFLNREERGVWRLMNLPFSRVSEDYGGAGSLWARAVRAYIDIQASHRPQDQAAALAALRDRARARDPGLATDIEGHLRRTSAKPGWPPP